MLRSRLYAAIVLLFTACFNPGDEEQVDTEGSSGDTSTSASTNTSTSGGTSASTTSDPTTGTDGSSTTAVDTGSSTGGTEPLDCVEAILDPAVGAGLASVDTNLGSDDFSGSCGGLSTPDAAFQWMVPYSGFFVLDTQGSDFDTVLYALDDACDGPELACSNDAEGTVSSRIVEAFEENDRVVVVVDGAAGAAGNAVLNINPVTCPSADLNGQVLPASFSNVAGTNLFSSGCGGDGNPERTFRYTAEQAGLYSFRTTSSDFTPVLAVEAGPICGGEPLQCNSGPGQVGAEVIRSLAAGESVTLIADSAGGTGMFAIDVVDLGLACPAETIESFTTLSGDIASYPHAMTTSCGPVGEVFSGEVTDFGAATFAWTSPGQIGSGSGCGISVAAGFPVALSLQEGACDGAEQQCEVGVLDETINRYVTSVEVGHIPATDFTITVTQTADNLVFAPDTLFEVEINCFAVG
jgi:hypothetical protein